MPEPWEEILLVLKELFDAVKVAQLPNEKMDWIRRGLFDVLLSRNVTSQFSSDIAVDTAAVNLSPQQRRDLLITKVCPLAILWFDIGFTDPTPSCIEQLRGVPDYVPDIYGRNAIVTRRRRRP